jgi:5-methylcytosine-specific restriction endonuclease McrA
MGQLKINKAIVLRTTGAFCKHCGATDNLTIDHIRPRSKGGKNTVCNLQVLCEPCNVKKASKMPDPPKWDYF